MLEKLSYVSHLPAISTLECGSAGWDEDSRNLREKVSESCQLMLLRMRNSDFCATQDDASKRFLAFKSLFESVMYM